MYLCYITVYCILYLLHYINVSLPVTLYVTLMSGGSECLVSNINLEKICQESTNNCPCKLETSCDAGRQVVFCFALYIKTVLSNWLRRGDMLPKC